METIESGKVAVITGATGGIGTAVARALSGAGYSLVLTAPSMEKLCAFATELAGPCTVVAGNLSDESIPETLLEAALDRFGRCDVCFNNGGLLEDGLIETIDIERVCNMVRVNIEGAFRVAYVFLKHFVSEEHGHLVNISSGVGKNERPTAYTATQSAIEILSDALSRELNETDVHVSCIQPGLVKKGLHQRWAVTPKEGTEEQLEPEDIARMVLFILEQPQDIGVSPPVDPAEAQ
jgi:NADP-dependent 3-hydroxy acid dehydrogenase YdfG